VRPHYIVREGPSGADGFVAWHPKREYNMNGTYGSIGVDDMVAATPQAYQALWRYLAELDTVGEVSVGLRPVDEPLRWLLPDSRTLVQDEVRDGVWLRFLDLPAALAARRYAVDDQLVIEVIDAEIGGYAAGRFALDGGPGHAECRVASAGSADLTLSQRALASIYLGGYTLREQLMAGLVHEHTPGAVRRMDAMFSTGLAPSCYTSF
jgi:predicted acetyltransferase